MHTESRHSTSGGQDFGQGSREPLNPGIVRLREQGWDISTDPVDITRVDDYMLNQIGLK